MAVAEGTKKNKSFQNFRGVNTQADRRVIDDDEFAWLENVMPIGYGNAKTIPAPSAALATLSATCYYMAEGNIATVSYMFMFCTDGSCYQVNLTTFAKTTVGAAATFSGTATRIAQWKNERIVIIDTTNGFFDWDGATLTKYKGTIGYATVVSPGLGIGGGASSPAITPTGGGFSVAATFTCTMGAQLTAVSATGAGYVVGDILTVVGGTNTVAATIYVSGVAAGAVATAYVLTPGSYTVTPANPAATTGGHGAGATFTMTYGIGSVIVATPGSGYTSAPTLAASAPSTNAVLIASLGVSVTGSTIATYAGRVWIGFNRTIVFSAPNTYNDFNPADLAGSLIMTDDTMRSQISRLFSSNSFLYVISANSINVISNVTVTNPVVNTLNQIVTPSTTTFSNTNLSPSIGTEMPDSVLSYLRTIVLSVDYGIFGVTGSTPQKVSDALDGIYPYIDFTKNFSCGLGLIYNILCMCYLATYNDPLTGTARPLLLIHFNKKWFFASQGAAITFIATASPDADRPALWATDGLNLYQLFYDTTSNISQTIRTKLWDMGSSLVTKQALKLGVESTTATQAGTTSVTVDTEWSTQNYTLSVGNIMKWYNAVGGEITWTNNVGAPLIWGQSGYVFSTGNVNNVGNYLGISVTSSTPGITFTGFHLQYEPRTPWAFLPF